MREFKYGSSFTIGFPLFDIDSLLRLFATVTGRHLIGNELNRDSETVKIESLRADAVRKSHSFCKAQIRLQKTESEPP